MTVIVKDGTFVADAWQGRVLDIDALKVSETGGHAVDVPVDADLSEIAPFLEQIAMIRVPFGSSADGRGFSVAQRLRLMGFRGVLRGVGDIVSDQYKHAVRVGFDEIEISKALAERQPEAEWAFAAEAAALDYRTHIRKAS